MVRRRDLKIGARWVYLYRAIDQLLWVPTVAGACVTPRCR